jgi:hypothetical protein
MGKSYQRKTRRSRRKLQDLQHQTVTVDVGAGQASFQMVLPLSPLLAEVAGAIEQTASQAGLLMMKALIDEEVEQIAGSRYRHQTDRQATRWGHDEGHVIFAGRKVALYPSGMGFRCHAVMTWKFSVSRPRSAVACLAIPAKNSWQAAWNSAKCS